MEYCYQEAGRAGRDGEMSQCILMFRFEARNKLLQLILKSSGEAEVKSQLDGLNQVVSYCMSSSCRQKIILDYFDDKSKVVCDKNCDNCLKVPPAQRNLTKEAINICQCVKDMQVVNAKINVIQLHSKDQNPNVMLRAKVFILFQVVALHKFHLRMTLML